MNHLDLYHRLSHNSKKAILRKTKKWGHPSYYCPRQDLVERLAEEMKKSSTEIRVGLMELRAWLLKHSQYY